MSLMKRRAKQKAADDDITVKSPPMKKTSSSSSFGGSVFKNPKLSDSVLSRIRKRPRIQDITNRRVSGYQVISLKDLKRG